jgi:hypothetical protein
MGKYGWAHVPPASVVSPALSGVAVGGTGVGVGGTGVSVGGTGVAVGASVGASVGAVVAAVVGGASSLDASSDAVEVDVGGVHAATTKIKLRITRVIGRFLIVCLLIGFQRYRRSYIVESTSPAP